MKLARVLLALLMPVVVASAMDNELMPREKKEGWILLFDGKSLDNWMAADGRPSKKPPENGSINPHGAGRYMLVYKQQWENFILKADFKISPRCNSGILFRVNPMVEVPDYGYYAIEMQILDSPGADYGDAGALYDLVKPTRNAMKPVGKWNHAEITANRNLIAVKLNGETVSRMNLDEWPEPNKRPDGTPHKFSYALKDHPRKGYIGLQDHGADVWFKNIKLKPLP
jgi:hypothetical protein